MIKIALRLSSIFFLYRTSISRLFTCLRLIELSAMAYGWDLGRSVGGLKTLSSALGHS